MFINKVQTIIFFGVLSAYSYAAPNSLLVEGAVGDYYFKLINNKPYCQLAITKNDKTLQRFPLNSQSPCYFFADSQHEKIQYYVYPDAKLDFVFLIGGTAVTLSTEERQLKKLPKDSYCTQDRLAIIVENNEIKTAPVDTKTFACAEDRLDEKVYQQVSTQPRKTLNATIKQEKQEKKADPSFFEVLQQKIEAIFNPKP